MKDKERYMTFSQDIMLHIDHQEGLPAVEMHRNELDNGHEYVVIKIANNLTLFVKEEQLHHIVKRLTQLSKNL